MDSHVDPKSVVRHVLPESWDDLISWVENQTVWGPEEKLRHLAAFQKLVQAYAQKDGRIKRLEGRVGELETEIAENKKTIHAAYDYFERELHKSQAAARKAIHDRLTQLPRRDTFDELTAEALQFERRDEVCVLVEFDVGDLKAVNDRISRKMGHLLLARASKVLRSEMRSEAKKRNSFSGVSVSDRRQPLLDLKARIGGDEFGVWIVLDRKKDDENYEDIALRIVERCCARFDRVNWGAQYPEWRKGLASKRHQASRKKEKAKPIKPRIDPGVVIIRMGALPRILSGSAKRHMERLMAIADENMRKSKEYRKVHRHRRIYYTSVEFTDRALRIASHDYFDSPSAI